MKRPTTGQNIALSVTVLVAILLMLLLLGVHLNVVEKSQQDKKESLALAELEQDELLDEEMFIEPELTNLGDPENTATDVEEAPLADGAPDISEVPNERLVVNGPNPKPNNEAEPLVATPAPSTVKTTTPSPKDDADQRVAANMSNQFSVHNGKSDGKESTASSGKGGEGSGQAKGDISGGRRLENNPTITGFSISKTITVKVSVMVKADGKVVPGSAKCMTSLQDASLKKKVEDASARTLWTPKTGAPTVQGTITWTLRPGNK